MKAAKQGIRRRAALVRIMKSTRYTSGRGILRFTAWCVSVCLAPVPSLWAQSVLTRSYDNSRSGANTLEKNLTPANVASVHKLRELALDPGDDPRIEAQPLYVPQLVTANGKHDVLIVSTMANNVYAFDVNSGTRLWKRNLGKPISPKQEGRLNTGLTKTDIDLFGVNLKWGILSTPVIDPDTNTLYVVSWSSADGKRDKAVHQLNALDLKTGKPSQKPLEIKGNAGQNVVYNAPDQKQRSALLLSPLHQPGGAHVKKTLFLAAGMTSEGAANGHGWLMAFDVDTFKQTAAHCTTPQSHAGGIWQGSQGPASDDQGNVYVMTSNGGWNGTTDLSESFVRLHYTGTALDAVDWFTPFLDKNRPASGPNGYEFTDQDLGSAGPVLVPGSNLLVGAGKDGVLYVFDRGNLGKKLVDQSKPALADNAPLLNAIYFTYFPGPQFQPLVSINAFPADGKTHHLHGSPVVWPSNAHGTMLFVWGENAALRAWAINPTGQTTFLGESQETASAFSNMYNAMPGGMITLSANVGQNGIVWASVPVKSNWIKLGRQTEGNANQEIVEGVLRAYDASSFQGTDANGNPQMKLLWENTAPGNSKPADTRYTYSKFCPPVVADGKVFLATYDGRVIIFGL
jgi:outer membrane protein assembly factor BamB